MKACPFQPAEDRKPSWIALAFAPASIEAHAVRALESYDGPELVQIAKREIYVY